MLSQGAHSDDATGSIGETLLASVRRFHTIFELAQSAPSQHASTVQARAQHRVNEQHVIGAQPPLGTGNAPLQNEVSCLQSQQACPSNTISDVTFQVAPQVSPRNPPPCNGRASAQEGDNDARDSRTPHRNISSEAVQTGERTSELLHHLESFSSGIGNLSAAVVSPPVSLHSFGDLAQQVVNVSRLQEQAIANGNQEMVEMIGAILTGLNAEIHAHTQQLQHPASGDSTHRHS